MLVLPLLWAKAPGASILLTVQIVVALIAVPLLYRALGETGQGWGGGTGVTLRRAFFALLGGLLCFQLMERASPEASMANMGRGFEAFVEGSTAYRFGFARLPEAATKGSDDLKPSQALPKLREAATQIPESVYLRRYLGIVQAEKGDYQEALRSLDQATKTLEERGSADRARRERQMWHALFGPTPPAKSHIEEARRQIEQFRLGWIGRVAVLAAYRRLGADAVPKELRTSIRRDATEWTTGGVFSGAMLLFIVPQLFLITLAVTIVLVTQRVLRPARPVLHPVGAILWESFILLMAVPVLLGLLPGRPRGAETSALMTSLYIIGQDVAQLIPLLYLWWRLRHVRLGTLESAKAQAVEPAPAPPVPMQPAVQPLPAAQPGRRLGLEEIGLTTRHFGANVLVGVMAAMIISPCAIVLGVLTEQLSSRLFPNVAPAFHPLGLMTATSGSPELRFALFFGAAIGAPFFEEIFFRGALFGALRRRFGFWPGILGSAAIFAILHPQLPLGFLPIALMGAAFAALYDWRGSLVPGMVAHAINNGMIFLVMMQRFPLQG